MTSIKNVALVGLILLMTGCSSLMPARVEHFQKKVKPVPVASAQPTLVEAQKQAAQFVDKKVAEAQTAAAATKADVTVQVPLAEAAVVSGPLVTSIGPPVAPWPSSAPKLADKVNTETAKLDKKVATYAEKTAPLVGKEIEGTGLIQMGFFTQWALVLGFMFLLFAAYKVFSMLYPGVGLAGKVVGRVSSKLLTAGLHQVVEGGERFKEAVKAHGKPLTPDEIKALFNQFHERAQDRSVQDLIARMTA